MAIPISELERLSKLPIHSLAIPQEKPETVLPDNRLGIKRDRYYYNGLMWDGEPREYAVPGNIIRHFTETEIKGYRAAFSAIANEFESLTELKKQLEKSATVSTSLEKEICTSRIGVWQVHSTLLNLGQSDILLCQRQGESAVVERFRDDSPYAKANGNAEITLEGNDARQLAAAFRHVFIKAHDGNRAGLLAGIADDVVFPIHILCLKKCKVGLCRAQMPRQLVDRQLLLPLRLARHH